MKMINILMLSLVLGLTACSQNPFGRPSGDPTATPDGDGASQETPAPDQSQGGTTPGDEQQAPTTPGTPDAGKPAEPTGPNFAVIRSQVLQSSCLRCHSGAGAGGVNLETYDSVLRNLSAIDEAVSSGAMPPRGMKAELKDLLLKWIQLGAPQ
jgi:cytochrome c5